MTPHIKFHCFCNFASNSSTAWYRKCSTIKRQTNFSHLILTKLNVQKFQGVFAIDSQFCDMFCQNNNSSLLCLCYDFCRGPFWLVDLKLPLSRLCFASRRCPFWLVDFKLPLTLEKKVFTKWRMEFSNWQKWLETIFSSLNSAFLLISKILF